MNHALQTSLWPRHLAGVETPTAIIWGRQDGFFPVAHAERAHQAIRGSELHVVPNAGHVSIWDRPETVNQLLSDFFSET